MARNELSDVAQSSTSLLLLLLLGFSGVQAEGCSEKKTAAGIAIDGEHVSLSQSAKEKMSLTGGRHKHNTFEEIDAQPASQVKLECFAHLK